MKPEDRQRLKVLLVLLGILGLTWWLGRWINQPPSASAVQATPAAARPAPAPARQQTDLRIRMDLLENTEIAGEIGRKNLFQYGPAAPPPAPAPKPPSGGLNAPPSSGGPGGDTSTKPATPPPPPVPLKYTGFAILDSTAGARTAFLTDEGRHFNVSEGEVLMGRFRIIRITESSVEVEDLEYNRRQTLPLIKQ